MPNQIEHSDTSSLAADYQLVAIEPDRLNQVWEMLEPMLMRIVDDSRGRFSFESLMQEIITHDLALWGVVGPKGLDAIVGTQLSVESSGLKTCTIRFVTGEDAKSWTHLIADLELYARQNGCSRIETWARKGWAKTTGS